MRIRAFGWCALFSLMLSTTHAADGNRYSTTLSVHGDENDNREWLGRVTLALGDHAWAQGSIGHSEFAAGEMKIAGLGFGVGGRKLRTAIEFAQRTDDDRFRQQNWTAALDWRGVRGGLGADAFVRSATAERTVTQPGGAFGSPSATTVRESADGSGFGLHGDLDLTARAKIFAGAMLYRYDFNAESAAPTSTMPLTGLLGTGNELAGVWRDQAFIDRSYRIGGSYQFRSTAVSAQYLLDQVAKTGERLESVQLQAEFWIGRHWLIVPMLGRSSGQDSEPVTYGGLSVGFNW